MIQLSPALPLQKAMYDALSTDPDLVGFLSGPVEIFDRVKDDVFPFIRIGEDREAPSDSECGSFTEIFSTVRIYSRAVGKVQAKRLAQRVRFILVKENDFSVDGFKVLNGYCESVSYEEHADGLTTQAILNFRYQIQPVSP